MQTPHVYKIIIIIIKEEGVMKESEIKNKCKKFKHNNKQPWKRDTTLIRNELVKLFLSLKSNR